MTLMFDFISNIQRVKQFDWILSNSTAFWTSLLWTTRWLKTTGISFDFGNQFEPGITLNTDDTVFASCRFK